MPYLSHLLTVRPQAPPTAHAAWGWVVLGAAWLIGLLALQAWAGRGLRRLPRLEAMDGRLAAGREDWPLLSVLVAARNEAHTVEQGMRSLLAVDYPRMELIAVDDRSTDETGAVLDRLATEDARLRVVHLTALPDGWLGKCHALQLAADAARGEWLLFTDADVGFSRTALRRTVAFAEREGFDHLAGAPGVHAPGTGLALLIATFSLVFTLGSRPWAAPDPRDAAVVGVGPFNLVRASAYRSSGGHAALPLAILDDVILGRVLKRAGFRQAMVVATRADGEDPRPGHPYLRFPWYPSLRAAIVGLEKNAFAAFDFRVPALAAWVVGLSALMWGPFISAALAPGWQRLPWIAAALLTCTALRAAGREVLGRFSWPLSLLLPVGWALLAYTVVRSAWITLRQRGVRWRDTVYPLKQLRGQQLGRTGPE